MTNGKTSEAEALVALIKAIYSADQPAVLKAVETLIQEKRSRGHRLLAERLEKILRSPPRQSPAHSHSFRPVAVDARTKDTIIELAPARSLDSLVLSDSIRTPLLEIIEEQRHCELLHAQGLAPRHRILLAGPPGNGKTTIAEALAFELKVPLIVVRYESLIGSYMGETGSRLRSLLDYAIAQHCVLFFDEFETLGAERDNTHDTGEIRRIVSSLLLQLDGLPDHVVVVAASNHHELLDRAVWRRFQLRLGLPLPTQNQLTAFIAAISERSGVNFGFAAQSIAKRLPGVSFSEAEEFCLGIARRAALDQKTDNAQTIVISRLRQWKNRLKPARKDTPNHACGERRGWND